MISYIVKNRGEHQIRISVELEKPKKELLELAWEADVVFIGKDFAINNNWEDMDKAVISMKEFVNPRLVFSTAHIYYLKEELIHEQNLIYYSAIVICTWGDKGAVAMQNDIITKSPAYSPDILVDSLGAGDTFCATIIHLLRESTPLDKSLNIACRLAGAKIGIKGFSEIRQLYNNIINES